MVQLRVNGRIVGDWADTFKRTDDLTRPIWPPRRFGFQDIRLKQGENAFALAVESKNPESIGYKMAIDCLVLKRLGE